MRDDASDARKLTHVASGQAHERSDVKSYELPTALQLSLYPNLEPLQAQAPSAPNTHNNLPEEQSIAAQSAAHIFRPHTINEILKILEAEQGKSC